MVAMQAVHVALEMYESVLTRNREAEGYGQITAMMLSVRKSRELAKVEESMRAHAASFGIPPYETYSIFDENPCLYVIKGRVPTAVCTTPIEASIVAPVIGHLDTYKDPMQMLRGLLLG